MGDKKTHYLNMNLTDMQRDGNELFNFDRDLNENFEILDNTFGNLPQGIPPTNCTGLTIRKENGKAYLSWSDSKDTVIDGYTLCSWQKTIIVMKEGEYPANTADGEIVAINYERNKYANSELEIDLPDAEADYCFKAFPVSLNGVTNLDNHNRFGAIVYGFYIDKQNSNPVGRVHYIEANENFKKAYMDYSSGSFNYGDWEDVWFIKQLRPVMINKAGEVVEELDKNDYTKKIDGTASSVSTTSGELNCMIEFPQVWIKYVETVSRSYVYISNQKMDDDYHAWNFYNHNGELQDVKYISAYEGTIISNVMRSLSGQKVSTVTTATAEINAAVANGAGWYTRIYSDWQMLIALAVLISGSTNTQAAFGNGNQNFVEQNDNNKNRNVNLINNGTLDKKGLFWGSNDTTNHIAVKLFGIENPWGNAWDRIAGFINDRGRLLVKMTYSQVDGSTVTGYNQTASGYIDTGLTIGTNSQAYISKTKATPYGLIPVEFAGSSSTNEADGCWSNTTQLNYARVGSCCRDGLIDGLFALTLNDAPSSSNWNAGSALSYIAS